MEHWQDYLEKLVSELGEDSPASDQQIVDHQKMKHESFMQKVIQDNLNLAGEIRGVQVNG